MLIHTCLIGIGLLHLIETHVQDHLGVVWAQSVAGHDMVATDWTHMQCTVTAGVEKRKVAKVTASGTV
jgi:exosome complex RNA-binding protein Csl4